MANKVTLSQFWSIPPEELLTKLGADRTNGLSDKEARHRLKKYGPNTLKIRKNSSAWRLFFNQLNNPLIYMLLFAAGLSLILYDRTDALIIFAIILASSLLGFFQERGAVRAVEKLLELVRIRAAVRRNGRIQDIAVEDLVSGDIIELNAGDVIPADCLLLEAKDLYVDEAALTGETFYVEKHPGQSAKTTPLSKRSNALFFGTHVVSGTAKALAVLTGKESEFGKISGRLAISPPETEFEHGVRRFGYFLMAVTLVLLIAIFAFNVYLERPVVESLLFALSLSVGLTPQLLPAIISINLAHGAKRMARKHVIVKRLVSIENFGSMNILCADKTGTITTGEVVLDAANDCEGKTSEKVLLYAALNSTFQTGYNNPIDKAIVKRSSTPLEGWQKVDEVPYDFTRKRLSILVKKDSMELMVTKGAFEQILETCTHAEMTSESLADINTSKEALVNRYKEYCNAGYRVLGVSYRKEAGISTLQPEDEKEMVFLGFLLFSDPLKADIMKTISEMEKAGISLKLITGDNKLVAMHIAKQLGLEENVLMTGSELHQMEDHDLEKQVNSKSIFAEIEPNQKERIILALRKAGNVVGFLGDGINDVTALHAADVSISVDSAVDAAKEVADIVLMKHDLTVLKEGVAAGRLTFANTLKYIFMASSANFGNMFSMAGASLFLSFLPLLPKQVLLTNLLTDFPEMTIATDSVDKEMTEKPLRWNIAFIRRFMLIFGLISSLFDYATFGLLILLRASVEEFRTGWFIESVVSATLIVLVVRTFKPFYRSRPSKYLLAMVILIVLLTALLPFMPFTEYLGFTPLPAFYYLALALIIVLYVTFVEIAKKLFLRR